MRYEEERALQVFTYLKRYPEPVRVSIRRLMRDTLFDDEILNEFTFKKIAGKRAVELQGESGGYAYEPQDQWLDRLREARRQIIDFMFAVNYSLDYLKAMIIDHSAEMESEFNIRLELDYDFNIDVEKASTKLLVMKMNHFESLTEHEKMRLQPEMRELKIVLLKRLVTEIPEQVRIAENFLSMADLQQLYRSMLGTGKIGGKSTGMLIAYRIMQYAHEEDQYDYRRFIRIPESHYLGDEVCIQYLDYNGLLGYRNQKFKLNDVIEREYGEIREKVLMGRFQDAIWGQFRALLGNIGKKPIIVRSSSLLEDNIGFSFAGKYDSYFLANQGTLKENLRAFANAIKTIYAGVFSSDAIIYRKRSMMQYDYESMGILIQEVVGKQVGRYFFPSMAGVIFSENPYIWSKRIKKEDGLIRMVYGLGTRAVDRVGEDYPRMVSLTMPDLRPEAHDDLVKYSQKFVDVIDLETNDLVTVTCQEILDQEPMAAHAFIHSIQKDDMVRPAITTVDFMDNRAVITFDRLLSSTSFAPIISAMINKIKRFYGHELDIEFAGELESDGSFTLYLLQCRPQSIRRGCESVEIPSVLPEKILFTLTSEVPFCKIENIDYLIYVDPDEYDRVARVSDRYEIARIVGRINKEMERRTAILLGPGRWGSNNINLGVPVKYNEINNFRLLGEIARVKSGVVPEVSFGTHFFQDLVEAGIHYIPIYPDNDGVVFNEEFFNNGPNCFSALVRGDAYKAFEKVVKVFRFDGNEKAHIYLDGAAQQGVCFMAEPMVEKVCTQHQ